MLVPPLRASRDQRALLQVRRRHRGPGWADFHPSRNGQAYKITITNETGQTVQVNGYDVAEFNASGEQVNLYQYTSQDGSPGQLIATQYIDPGQSIWSGDDTGINATSCKLAGWH
jgi:hypothetical protein